MGLCPACGSVSVEHIYPPIPDLSEEPLLAMVVAAEAQIPRMEGVILHREMVAWLRFHGVRSKAEMLTWEWLFREIGGIRSRIVEEMTATTPGKDGEDRPEE